MTTKRTRSQIIDRLRELGYDGPVSYAKSRLEELLLEHDESAGAPTVEQPEDAPRCNVCGTPKARGTITRGQEVKQIWMCPALPSEHDRARAVSASSDGKYQVTQPGAPDPSKFEGGSTVGAVMDCGHTMRGLLAAEGRKTLCFGPGCGVQREVVEEWEGRTSTPPTPRPEPALSIVINDGESIHVPVEVRAAGDILVLDGEHMVVELPPDVVDMIRDMAQ